ncbi:sigma-54 interaction domain-containing protein [Paracidobacterium acidisoli]|nr:sigma-54 dependent transcriptional regulator [Paracidobacterium acidisoli]MBT9330261.1 sigma-54 dependent transcriptional regulator [Paracidobacterium acidisoli]
MSGEIVLVGENSDLYRRLGDQEFSVLPIREIADAISYLRDPAASAAVALFPVSMRRQHDVSALTEISTLHPYLQIIVMADAIHGDLPELPVRNANLRTVDKGSTLSELCDTVRHAVHAAEALAEKAAKHQPMPAPEMADDSLPLFSTAFLTRVGLADVPVLLHGETGVGKEVMARRLCAYSPRANKPFLKLNCAALPSELVESELFGYEKGAFTGAVTDKPGRFEIAQGGTILLDEIGDMDVRLQAKLLTVLQDGEIQPLGSSRTIKVNVRVLAATHRDLRRAIEQGTFREDLYYRLNVINIVIPPLRERRDEILPLAENLLRRHLRPGTAAPMMTEDLKSILLEYHWPGNIRELENVMRRYLVYQSATMLVDELARNMEQSRPRPVLSLTENYRFAGNGNVSSMDKLAEESRQAEAKLLLDTLESTRWNRRQAAARLNLEYKAFLYKLQKFGIAEKKDKPEAECGT